MGLWNQNDIITIEISVGGPDEIKNIYNHLGDVQGLFIVKI